MQRLKTIVNRLLPRASFVRNVGILAGGTALAQAVGVLALPLITRLYTPEQFSLLAVFSSIVAIVSVAACLRLEIAIPLTESDTEAAHLLVLSLLFSTTVSALTGMVVWLFTTDILAALRAPGLKPYLWMLPLAIWLASSYSAVQFWATRRKRFLAVSKTRLTQSISSAAAQVSLGLAGGFGALGLFLASLLSAGAGLLGLARSAWRGDSALQQRFSRSELKRVFLLYQRFPKYSTIEALANLAAIQLPIIIIGAVAIGPEAGYLMLAMKTAAIPLGLIGSSVSQVYLSKAAEEHRKNQLSAFTLNIIDGLVKTGLGPLLFVGIISPSVFPMIFGDQWQRAGEMITWMTPWLIMQYLASPLSMALHVTGNQKIALYNQIVGVTIRVGTVYLASIYSKDLIFETYAFSGWIFYSLYLYLVLFMSGITPSSGIKILLKNTPIIITWISLGLLTMVTVKNIFY